MYSSEIKKGGFETMNKNLKKVISAFAALTLSVTTFTAFASDFPDVPADASYKHAVDELVALDVVDGDENGNFAPDNLVTRAEFAKMTVCALGPARRTMAEAAAGQTSKFPDVRDDGTGKAHWASGYITACTSDNIIIGYEDGTFKPDDNISYVEVMKVLVVATGYDAYAVQKGGWENGYLSQGNELGIGDGVSVTSSDQQLTRAQCAQMVANALKAPVCISTGESNILTGQPVTAIKNGTGRNYQTILTNNHNAYEVYGRVTETSKTASGSMDPDEVRFQVERATNFEKEYITRNDEPIDFIANVGDTNAADSLRVYSEAIVRVNDFDEYELICLRALGTNAETGFYAADFNADNRNYKDSDALDDNNDPIKAVETTGRFYAYENGTSTERSYKLNVEDGQFNGSFYVNGVDMSGTGKTFDELVHEYITNNNTGYVTLVAESATGSVSTSGNYNTIMVTYYQDAIVEDVEIGSSDAEIYFLEREEDLDDSLVIDFEDDETDYSIKKNGASINVEDIKPYDVVSVAWDVTNSSFKDSSFYDVIVSNQDIWEGQTSSREKDGVPQFQLDGTWYDAAGSTLKDWMVKKTDIERLTTYQVYRDDFGKVVYVEELSSDKKLAILDSIYRSTDQETIYVKLVYNDGTSGSVELGSKLENREQEYYDYIWGTDGDAYKNEPQDRVVQYRTNSSNQLTQLDPVDGYKSVTAEYRESSNRIGQYTFSDSTAAIVVKAASDGWDFAKLDPSTLYDEEEYTAYFYERSASGNYAFAIVMDESGGWSKSTQMAAYISTQNTSDDNYSYALELLVPDSNEVVSVNLSDDDYKAKGDVPDEFYVSYSDLENGRLEEGTPILYTVDSSGAVTGVRRVISHDKDYFINGNFEDLTSAVRSNGDDLDDMIDKTFKSDDDVDSSDEYKLVFGLIVSKYSGQVDFVTKFDDYTANTISNDVETYGLSDNTAVYVYDYNGQSRYDTLVQKGSSSSVRATNFSSKSWIEGTDDTIADMLSVKSPQYAVARVLGDDIMEIMTFVPEK